MTTRYLFYSTVWAAGLATVLFVAAGDIRWPEAWVYLAEHTITAGAVVFWLARHDPALLRERFAVRFHRDQAVWDRLFLTFMMAAFLGWLVLMPLDARRFGWSHVPIALEAAGLLLLVASALVTWQTFRVNTFGVPQARVQANRHQTVISDGPYRIIRHPMYAGGFLYFIGLPLLLGSWYGVLAGVLLTICLALRSIGEEHLLRRDLGGYEAYAEKVRWRMVPGIW